MLYCLIKDLLRLHFSKCSVLEMAKPLFVKMEILPRNEKLSINLEYSNGA